MKEDQKMEFVSLNVDIISIEEVMGHVSVIMVFGEMHMVNVDPSIVQKELHGINIFKIVFLFAEGIKYL